MLEVAWPCIDRGVGCTIRVGGSGVSYRDSAPGDRCTAGTIAFIQSNMHVHTRTHTHKQHTLTKGPGSNVIMSVVSQLVKEDTG